MWGKNKYYDFIDVIAVLTLKNLNQEITARKFI